MYETTSGKSKILVSQAEKTEFSSTWVGMYQPQNFWLLGQFWVWTFGVLRLAVLGFGWFWNLGFNSSHEL